MAQYMAKWGPKGFLVSPYKIVPLTNFTTGFSFKQDNNEDTSGTEPTNTRGRDLEVISFETQYLSAAGVNPRGQIEEWKSLVGAYYPLYIGGQRFGPDLLRLISVDCDDFLFSPSGEIIGVVIKITLKEYVAEEKTTVTTSSASGGSSVKPLQVTSSSGKLSVSEQRAAANAKPTAVQKQVAMKY